MNNYVTKSGLLILLITCLFSLHGQESEILQKRKVGSGVFLKFENNFIDVSKFNSLLKDNSLHSCDFEPLTLGYGLFFQVKKIVTFISYYSSVKETQDDIGKSKIDYYAFCIDFGYDFPTVGDHMFSPRY